MHADATDVTTEYSYMRLLDTSTAELLWVNEPRHVSYAIVSHVWVHEGQGYKGKNNTIPAAVSEKIRRCCAVAREHGFERIWIDSCCIDRESSSELSEAINSMYNWYLHAKVCYVYLADVEYADDPAARGSQFRRSQWFCRGWTLQELIAPRVLVFLSKDWRILGTKTMLASVIEEVTGIDRAILTHERSLDTVSIAKRISWASRRRTTRVEDEAYSLMGVLGVNLPAIYGEGRLAFIRLQEEVIKQTSDQTLFAWGPTLRDNVELDDDFPEEPAYFWEQPEEAVWEELYMRNLFALSPRDFASAGRVTSLSRHTFCEQLQLACPLPDYTVTGHGVRTTVPILSAKSKHSGDPIELAILSC
ncbi:HET-domain-containing protein [Lentinus tigrinus ALCF2SS1-6]|uniref:HET-domain-containing protein n=1 Tax=Lentinus tigrinus ALCF2SS1-6 TaxID=1328759 RepID=A0A5C2RVD0_9APHY|nr:HET-domain-containing protein [Lentinus tigrinus ALCF2SS1-6]